MACSKSVESFEEEMERRLRNLYGSAQSLWIGAIHMELINQGLNPMLVDESNCQDFIGLTPQQIAEKIKSELYLVY